MTQSLAPRAEGHQTLRRWAVGVSKNHSVMTICGVEIAYEDTGMGQVVIGLHATAHGARDFEHLRHQLKDGYRVITLDWPSHGRSGTDSQPFDAVRCTQILTAFVEKLNLSQVVIIGCSIGGAAALRYAHAHPENVLAIVACNAGGLAPVDTMGKLFCRAMIKLAQAGGDGRVWFKPAFTLFCASVLQTKSARAQRQRIIEAASECTVPLADAWRSFLQPEADIRGLAAKLTVPVLYAWARHDRIVALAPSLKAIKQTPKHELVLLNGGHCAFLEDPVNFANAFQGFVNNLKTTAP